MPQFLNGCRPSVPWVAISSRLLLHTAATAILPSNRTSSIAHVSPGIACSFWLCSDGEEVVSLVLLATKTVVMTMVATAVSSGPEPHKS